MPKPVCVKCQRFFRPKMNGVAVTEMMPFVHGAKPGTEEAEKWKPYKLWRADLWKCEGCGFELVCGFAGTPYGEHYQDDFVDKQRKSGADKIIINDC